MKRINYFASCPCCGEIHIISMERGILTQFELDDLALSLCSCGAALMRHDHMRAKENLENGFTDMMRDANRPIGETPEKCCIGPGGVANG